MKDEICAAVAFLTRLVGKSKDLTTDQVEVFRATLGAILTEKFEGHWFPEKPCRGQAYRCIRVNGRERRDPVLEQAAQMCGLRYQDLSLPPELTLWVDPKEVCCRFGEDEGSYCTVASFKDNKENLVDNICFQERHLKSSLHQIASDCPKKQKSRRRVVDRQKKSTAQPICSKNFSNMYYKFIPSDHFINFEVIRSDASPLYRRPKKSVRLVMCPNDNNHWVRK